MKQHQTTYYIERPIADGEEETNYEEIELRVTYTFLRAVSEQGPTYASGGQPAEPASVEDVYCYDIANNELEITDKEMSLLIEYIVENHYGHY